MSISAVAISITSGMLAFLASFDVKNSEFRTVKNISKGKENVYYSEQDVSAQVNTQRVVTREGKLITYSSLSREDAAIGDIKIHNSYFQNVSGHILDFGESILEKQTTSKNDFRLGKYKGNLQDKLRRDKESVVKLHAQKKELVRNFLVQRKKAAGPEVSKKIKASWTKSFNGVHIEGVYLSRDEIYDLKAQGIEVLPNYQYTATLMDSVAAVRALNIDERGEDCVMTQKKCLDGSGVRAAVIDTGVDYTRNELGGCFGQGCKVVDGYDYVNGDNDPMDDNGHGTHVAGIISADGALKGVAPKTQIYAYKVLDAKGTGWVSRIISAIERSVDPNFDGNFDDKIPIVNLSLGGPIFLDDPMPQVVDTVSRAGVVVVVAGGNSGPGGNMACYGEGKQRLRSICSPGNALEAITVGATYKKDYEGFYWLDKDPRIDTVTSFSSRGPAFFQKDGDTFYFSMKPDVAAPGAIICSTRYDSIFPLGENSYYYPCNNDEEHVQLAGTSMAAPMVAGVASLLLEGHPDWTPQQIKFALRNSADDLGQNYYLQGRGRVNLKKAVAITRPLIAQLYSTSLRDKALTLSGTFDGANLHHFEIYYSFGIEGKDYILLDSKPISDPIRNGTLYRGSFDPLQAGNGYISFKAALFDNNGNQTSDESFARLKNYEILNPLEADVYRLGSKISIEANLPDEYEYRIEYGLGTEPSGWSSQGINLFRNGATIGEWDTSILPSGEFYGMRIIMSYKGREFAHRIKLYLDPTLKEGWPQRVKLDTLSRGGYRFLSRGGFLEPVAADIDNDRKKEIIVFRSGIKNILRVYRDDGSVYWEKELDSSLLDGDVLLTGYEPIPIVSDLNNDGYKEILVLDAHSFRDETNSPRARLVVFDYTGDLYDKMAFNPVDLPIMFGASMIVSDLNVDEKKEIIMRSHTPNFFMILDWKGNEISRRDLPPTNWGGDIMSHPAVGNFDDDSDLEIVLAGPGEGAGGWNPETGDIKRSGFVSVYNMDGSEVNAGWPKKFSDPIFSSPAVGDINHDGMDDIVVGLFRNDVTGEGGGVYAMDRYGNVLEGWPALTGWNYWASPSLSDYNNDGYLEVGVSRIGFVTSLIDWRGQVQWEGVMPWNSYYAVVAADIDNDRIPNILTTSDNGFDNFGWGGVHAWNIIGGQEVRNKFPKVTETTAQAPITISDIDGDGFVEIVASSWWNPFADRGSSFRDTLYVWDIDAAYNPDFMPWPEFQHDAERTGRYTPLPDRTPPVVRLINPQPQERIRGMVTITAEAWDYHSSVENVEFYLDNFALPIGEGKKDAVRATSTSVLWDTTSVANGFHTLRAKAYDASGNSALSQAVEVITQNPFFLRGDANADGEIDISDPIRIILYLFSDNLEIANQTPCLDALDANDDGQLDISDSIYLLNYLFKGGLRPPEPISQIGIDPTDDSLACLEI